ncbi:MAG: hydrogenase iron-sulfur subunit [Candidatus Lokiarchaeota archaeon]|nr:hydrogenase iron-sulfur subunit [Candidatus Lokiarchaeota archaeon]
MEFKILIITTPGCILSEQILTELMNKKDGNLLKISKDENLGTLDVKRIISAILDGIDGIFIIIKRKIKDGKKYSNYDSFIKVIVEANRILERRDFGDNRVNFCYWAGKSSHELTKEFSRFYKSIKSLGLNPLNQEKLELHV